MLESVFRGRPLDETESVSLSAGKIGLVVPLGVTSLKEDQLPAENSWLFQWPSESE